MAHLSDNEIIRRCQQGDTEYFRELVKRYQEKILWIAYQMVNNYEEARDISQEALIRVYRALSQFKLTSNFYTWLYRIVINLCIDFLRKNRYNSRPLSIDEIGEVKSAGVPIVLTLEQKELKQEVHYVLNQLPVQYRIVLLLRDIEGFSCKEIEKIIACNHNTVRWRLFRARQIFKDAWEKHQLSHDSKNALPELSGKGKIVK